MWVHFAVNDDWPIASRTHLCKMNATDSCKSIFEYLKSVDIHDLDELYSHPPTCLIIFRYALCASYSIFRELRELSKHLVLRLLFLEQKIPKSIVAGWVAKGSQDLLQQACTDLSDLRVWHSIDSDSARGSWQLNKRFQDSMKVSLFGGYIFRWFMPILLEDNSF